MSAYAAHAARSEEWLPVRLKVALAALCGLLCGLLYGLAVMGLHTVPPVHADAARPVAAHVAGHGTPAGSRVAGLRPVAWEWSRVAHRHGHPEVRFTHVERERVERVLYAAWERGLISGDLAAKVERAIGYDPREEVTDRGAAHRIHAGRSATHAPLQASPEKTGERFACYYGEPVPGQWDCVPWSERDTPPDSEVTLNPRAR